MGHVIQRFETNTQSQDEDWELLVFAATTLVQSTPGKITHLEICELILATFMPQ